MSKRVLSLVLALVMVLGSFSFVSAAAYEDVTDADVKKAVDRLSLLAILEGYPDGTFKPGNTITRAEFAAVAVRAKGLADAANASKGLATGFTDVGTEHWAAGFITTASKLGVVNGVGNGLFAPGAPVKYEEAVTMIVRALGYEAAAQTKGGYPYGYLIVANEIGLLDEVKGTQGAPATRGIVAQITDNALEIPKMIQVGYGSDAKWVISGSKEHGDEAEEQYLLHDLGVDEIKGYVTNNFRIKSTLDEDEVEIDGVKYDIAEGVDIDAVLGAGVTAWAKDDVVFSISLGFTIKQSSGKDIVFDEDQVLYDVAYGDERSKDEIYLHRQDDDFDFASRARIYVNNEKADAEDIPENAYGRFVLNDDDDIEFAYLFDIADVDTGIVTEISSTDLDYVNLNADEDVLPLDDAEEIYVFNKDLSQASLDDIEEDSAVFYWIDEDDNYFIIVSDEKLEGTLEAVRVRDNRLTVAGTNIDADDYTFMFSSDDKEEFNLITPEEFDDLEDYVDEDVVVYKNLAGTALAMVTGTDKASSTVFGLATWMTGDRNPELSVYTADGKEVEYVFEDRDDVPSVFRTRNFDTTPTGVYFKVNKDGEIKEGTFEYSNTIKEFGKVDDNKYGTWGSDRLYITEDTVIIEAYDDKANDLDPSVIKYENIINKTIDANHSAIVIREDLLTDDGDDDLGLLIFTDVDFTASDDEEYGIVTSDPVRRGSDYRVEIDVYGKGKETYVVSKVEDAKDLRTGDIIEFELDGKGELLLNREVDSRTDRKDASKYEVVNSKSNNFITTTKGNTYRNTKDTVYYSIDKNGDFRSSASSFSRINEGSVILLMVDDNELVGVLDITAWIGAQPVTPAPSEDTGVVTYINKDAGRELIEIDYGKGNVVEYTLTGAARTLVNKVEIGDTVVPTITDGKLIDLEVKDSPAAKEEADKAAAKLVDDAIVALEFVDEDAPTAAEIKAVEDARADYEALTKDQQKLVKKLAELEAAEGKVAVAADKAAAKLVDDAIVALKFVDEDAPTAAEIKAVEDARADYEALTKDQQKLVKKLAELEAAEGKVAAAAEKAAVEAVNAAKDKFDMKKAVNDNLEALEIDEAITTEAADYLLAKIGDGYANAKAIRDALADYAKL